MPDPTQDDPDDPTFMTDPDPTPNGGVSSVCFYMDADGNPCPRSKSVASEIHHLDKNGNSVFREYMCVPGVEMFPTPPPRGR